MNNIEECKKALKKAEDTLLIVRNDIDNEIKEVSKKEKISNTLSYISFGTACAFSLPSLSYLIGAIANNALHMGMASYALAGVAIGFVGYVYSCYEERKREIYSDQLTDALDRLEPIKDLEEELIEAKEILKAEELKNSKQDEKTYTDGYTDEIVEGFSLGNYYNNSLNPKVLSRKL